MTADLESANVIREAAALIRERAMAATAGPWTTTEEHGRDIADEGWSLVGVEAQPHSTMNVPVAWTYSPGFEDNENASLDASHIASWHPLVAMAVANWLDEFLRWHWTGCTGDCTQMQAPLAVAHAYLNTLTATTTTGE